MTDVTRDDVALDLLNTNDAQVWAQQFIAIIKDEKYPGADPYDEGFMIGWFANAIAAGEIKAPKVNPVTVVTLDLGEGKLTHVRVGIEDLGDGLGPWIPQEEDIERVREDFENAVAEGKQFVVTHMGVTTQEIGNADRS